MAYQKKLVSTVAGVAATVGAAITCIVLISVLTESRGLAQRGVDTREFTLDFQVTQGSDCPGPNSNDQITILFSNQTTEAALPRIVLGEDILQEFSFSARDLTIAPSRGQSAPASQRRIQFRRRVRDRGFLDARFIRVINTGGDGWCGGTLSMGLDGAPLLPTTPLVPRRGNPSNGIQDWNQDNWSNRTYWEGNLQMLLGSARK